MRCTRLSASRLVGVILLSPLATAVWGCSKAPVRTVPVEGTVTLGGGQWPEAGMVVFAPKEPAEGYPRRAGQAIFDRDGRYVATTFESHDGLIPGNYSVNLRCITQNGGDITKAVNHVPPKYRRGELSGFEVTVPADDSRVLVFDFDVPAGGRR